MIDVVGVLVVLAALTLCAYTSWGWRHTLARMDRGPLAVTLIGWSLIDVAFVSYVIVCYWYGGMWSVLLLLASVLATRYLMSRGWVP